MALLLGSVVAVVVCGLLYWWYLVEEKKLLKDVPTPPRFPILGHSILALKENTRVPQLTVELAEKYGTVLHVLMPLSHPLVLVADPVCVEHILKTKFENYVKGTEFTSRLYDLLGDGIFNSDGEMWKSQRQVASHMFKIKELKGMIPVFADHGKHVIDKLAIVADRDAPINIAEILFKFTLDSIGEIAFGYNIDSQHSEAPFASAFDSAQEAMFIRFLLPNILWKPLVQIKKQVQVLNSFAATMISWKKKDSNIKENKDLLSRYMSMDGGSYSEKYLRDMILNVILAGRDTTAQTITWSLYLLSQNPDKCALLLEEIKQIKSTLFDSLPDYTTLKNMKYMKAVINEALRLYPPVPHDPKIALQDDILPNGYKISAGSQLFWSMYVMGRMEKYWNAPLEFRPERWLDPSTDKERHPYLFVPFQAGPRTCLGMNMAYAEASLLIYMILSRFDLHFVEGQKIEYQRALTLFPKNGIIMTVKTRKDE